MKIAIFLLIFFICQKCLGEFGAQEKYLPLSAKYFDTLNYKLTPFREINHGQGKNSIPLPDNSLYFPPAAYDVDENGNLYILYLLKLYKFNSKSVLEKVINFDSLIVDFKYYNHKIFLYDGSQIIVLKCGTLEEMSRIPLSALDIKDSKVLNVSIFYSKFFFIRDIKARSNEMKLRYVINLDEGKVIHSQYDSGFCLANLNCENCDLTFLKRLFDFNSNIEYFGQSSRYLIYEFICDKLYSPMVCPDFDVRKFYLLDKKNNFVYSLGDTFNKTFGGKIGTMCSRPFTFINDSTAIFQTTIKNQKILYHKIQFHTK